MNCGKWCAISGTMFLFPIMKLAEEGGEIEAISLYWPTWAWIVLFSIAIFAIFWWYLVMYPGQSKEVSEIESQLAGHHDDHHSGHGEEHERTAHEHTEKMVIEEPTAQSSDDLTEAMDHTASPVSENSDEQADPGTDKVDKSNQP